MLKVAAAGKDHRHAMFVGSRDDFGIVAGASRLNRGEDAGLRRLVDAVAEREEGVAGDDSAVASVGGFLRGDLRRIEPAHLTGTGAGDRSVFRENDCVGFDVLAEPPRESQVTQFSVGWLASRDDLPISFGIDLIVSRLHQQPAADSAIIHAGDRRGSR